MAEPMADSPAPLRLRIDTSVTRQRIRPGTVRRILPYALRHRGALTVLLATTVLDAGIAAATPLMLERIIDAGVLRHHESAILRWSSALAALAVVDAVAIYLQAWFSGRIGQGLIYDLRTTVFDHVQRQPVAFFARAQTGSLVSRLNSDVIGAQQAVTSLLSQSASTLLTLVLVLAAMFYLSWQISVATLVILPCFFVPGKVVGRRLQRLSRQTMQLDAEIGSMMNERFNVAGATLAKLYGRPEEESRRFAERAGRVRDVAVMTSVYSRLLFIVVSLLTALTTATIFGLGGILALHGAFGVGTLVAMSVLLTRLYGPVNQLSNLQVNVMTALVSFDRLFEVLDLAPLVAERPGARALPAPAPGAPAAPAIEFDHVGFGYPRADEVSLASLESVALRSAERAEQAQILHDVSFRAPAGALTALVGPSGAGKTTITQLVCRLYDATSGTVRVGGHDVRDLTLRSLYDTVGVVTQDAHVFHDTIRANLLYACPEATEDDLVRACEAARIWETISSLPGTLDTVVGDHGYRLSGGERQRLALARLLLKSPPVVILDEATAHLDSESELAIQRALKTALADRTSLVIAHRLSTVRDADQILVVDAGLIRERGTHTSLLAAGGLYSELYRAQFEGQESADDGGARDSLSAAVEGR